MKIAIPKERRANETRVAASPETVKKLVALGCEVVVEAGAGEAAAMLDKQFEEAGARIVNSTADATDGAALVLKVARPICGGAEDELQLLSKDTVLVSIMDPLRALEDAKAIAAAGVTAFAMDLVPRITRAQSMDVLSSQANLAGYKAVLDAAEAFPRAFPMMMTAAGTVSPAKVLVMGAGVAGLQAIATAKRLGAIVHATDVRPAAKEQVESLGGKFVAVEDEEFKQAETAGGYAKEMSDEYKRKQAALIAETIPKMDVVITTALIPGRPAPKLVGAEMVKSMKPGSVIVDLAVETGGNVEGSEAGKVVKRDGVKIIGYLNVPGRLAVDASQLYARNLFNFLQTIIDKDTKALKIDWEDEIVKGMLVAKGGQVVHPQVAKLAGIEPPAAKAEPASEGGAEQPKNEGAEGE